MTDQIDMLDIRPIGYAVMVWPDGYDPMVFLVETQEEEEALVERIETETHWNYDAPSHANGIWVHSLSQVDEIIAKHKLPDWPTDEDRA